MRKCAILSVLFIVSISAGAVFFQSSWSLPGGVLPVRTLAEEFQSAEGVNWWTSPGDLVLDYSPLRHGVDALPGGISSILCQDMNSDGLMDIVACEFRRSIVIYENTGTGTGFVIHPVLNTDGSGPETLVCADFDGDGDPDLAGTSTGNESVCWWENTGYSEWISHPLEAAGGIPFDAGDMDTDGDPDLLLGIAHPGGLIWLENRDGGASWVRHEIDGDLQSPCAAEILADGNGLVAASFSDSCFYRYRLDGDAWQKEAIAEARGPFCLESADMDSDGRADLIMGSSWDDRLFWQQMGGNGAETITVSEEMIAPVSLSAADVDGDGDIDVLAVSEAAGELLWWENTDDGRTFFAHYVGSISGISCCAVADMDGDGVPDLSAGSLLDGSISWFTLGEYRSRGSLTSSILYIGPDADGMAVGWEGESPSGTFVNLQVRVSADRTRMGDWTDVEGNPGEVGFLLKPDSRFIQYRILLATDNTKTTPRVSGVTLEVFPAFML